MRRQRMADGAEIAADHQQQRNAQAPPSSRARCACSSSGTMMPPTPSMNSMPEVAATARRLKAINSSKSMRALLARGGEIGRQRRAEAPGRDARDFVGADRLAQRLEQHRRIAGLDHGGIVAADHRLERVDGGAGAAQMPDQPGGDEGLADVGAGRGDEIGAHWTSIFSRTQAGEAVDRVVGMLRGEGEPQPRGAGRHRRRADGARRGSLARPASAEAASASSSAPITTGTIGLCASGRLVARVKRRAFCTGSAA